MDANSVCYLIAFRSGGLFITFSPNGRTILSLNVPFLVGGLFYKSKLLFVFMFYTTIFDLYTFSIERLLLLLFLLNNFRNLKLTGVADYRNFELSYY